MTDWRYTRGLHHVGGGSHAYLMPDGGWGWSNAGLVVDGDQSLLVDTLYGLQLTADMLATMAAALPAARHIDVLVNSHADGDHTFGNQLVKDARIVASSATLEEFFRIKPELMQSIIDDPDRFGPGGHFIKDNFPNEIRFDDIVLTAPTETFDRNLTLRVGDKDVHLINVGPAHTRGDTLVHVPQDRVVYTADVLFLGVHPAIWDGNLDGWIQACDLILAMDVDVVVPGHGPITDKAGVRLFKQYLVNVRNDTRKRFDAGMGIEEAARDIVFAPDYADWVSPERVVGCVNFLYKQWGSAEAADDVFDRFAMMKRYADGKAAEGYNAACGHVH